MDSPLFVYPNGGETITSRTINITWIRPADNVRDPFIWHELYFTDSWDTNKADDWRHIATVPPSAVGFVWNVPFSISSNKCRFAIRTRNTHAERSDYLISGDIFTIERSSLARPSVESPIDGGRYHHFVPIILDNSLIKDTSSRRSSYQIFYSSSDHQEDWKMIRQNVRVGSPPIYWDVRDLPASNDYSMKVALVDDDGKSSVPVFINNIQIDPMNYFILDTLPPSGTVSIEGDLEFTKERNIVVRLNAFDESTAVKSVQLREVSDSGTIDGPEQDMSNVKTWRIPGTEDGVRCIEAVFKDYGNNIIDETDDGEQEFFRSYISNNNAEVGSFLVVLDGSVFVVWTAFGGVSPALFRNKSSYISLDGLSTSMALFSSEIYLGIKTSDNKGNLQKIGESVVTDIYEFTDLDSVIMTMQEYDSNLYIGLQNGELHKFNGTTMTGVPVYDFGAQIDSLYSDGTLLYIGIEQTGSVYVYNGTGSPTLTEVINGSIQK
jgi:hypothetical protein